MPPSRLAACLASFAIAASAVEPPPRPHFVSSRDVVISFDARGDVQRVELWVSQDAGRSWRRAETTRWDRASLLYHAPADGRYELYLRLIGPQPMPAPTPGTVGHQSLVVDTVPPIVQIRSAAAVRDPPGIELDLIIIEEHLRPGAVRLLYRTASDNPWKDSGLHPSGSGTVRLPLPAEANERLDLRLIVTDAAGNRAFDDWRGLDVSAARAARPASQPAPAPPAAQASAPQKPAPPDPQIQARIDQLRERAGQQLALARYDQARRLLSQALELAPDDPGLLAALGTVWLRSGQRDKAEEILSQALAHGRPPEALEGLALIAALRHDWPTARQRLRELLELQPRSALVWLRLGDIEHRMGRKAAARDAWQRARTLAREKALKKRAEERLRLLAGVR